MWNEEELRALPSVIDGGLLIGVGVGGSFPSTTPLRARMISWVPRFSVSLDLSLLYMKERRYEHSHLREKEARSPRGAPPQVKL